MINREKLIETVTRLVNPPRGILAIDESNNSCNTRFLNLGVPQTEEKRREYRELLITTPGIEKYISGFILFDETIRQSTKDGKNFTTILQENGIDIGIKVDQGLVDFSLHEGEKITQGLDGLSERLQEYKNMGATFAKWRAVYQIGENTPSEELMKENAISLSKYASICQELDIVPIIEPEVLYNGTHTIEKCYEVMAHNFDIIFAELLKQNIFVPGIILKTSMVLAGKDAKEKSSAEAVARMTIKCLEEHVPSFIGGIVFLSGGQSDEDATINLNTMHCCGPLTWPLTFSYSRAIQNKTLQAWAKNPDDKMTAQALLLSATKNNSEASLGKYGQ